MLTVSDAQLVAQAADESGWSVATWLRFHVVPIAQREALEAIASGRRADGWRKRLEDPKPELKIT